MPLTAAESAARVGTRYGHLLADIPPGLNYSFYTERMGHPRPLFAWRSKFSDFNCVMRGVSFGPPFLPMGPSGPSGTPGCEGWAALPTSRGGGATGN